MRRLDGDTSILDRLLHHRRELVAEGCVTQAAFHVLALAQLWRAPKGDAEILDALCRPSDVPEEDRKARDVRVPFSDRFALTAELDGLLHGSAEVNDLEKLDDVAYAARRRRAAAVDFCRVDALAGALAMNAHAVRTPGRAFDVLREPSPRTFSRSRPRRLRGRPASRPSPRPRLRGLSA